MTGRTARQTGFTGFEIEFARILAADMGVWPEYKVCVLEDIIPAVIEGEIDVIAGGMAITPGRALKINFSRPYAGAGISLATNTAKTRDIKHFQELNQPSIEIAVISKSASEQLARRLFDKAALKVLDSSIQAEQAILKGEVHAWLAAMPQPQFLALRHPQEIDLPLNKPVLSFKSGIRHQKGRSGKPNPV